MGCRISTAPPTRREYRHDPRRARTRRHPARHQVTTTAWGTMNCSCARPLDGCARDRFVLSVKFGALRDPKAIGPASTDGPSRSRTSRLHAAQARDRSRRHLSLGRIDRAVPIEDTVGAIAEMVKAATCAMSPFGGGRRHAGAGVAPCTDRRPADRVLAVLARIEAGDPAGCRRLGVGCTAYGVLSRGLLSGHWSRERSQSGPDSRAFMPRFTGDNLERNLALVDALRAVAAKQGATVAQAAIAWVLSRGSDIVPLVGARRHRNSWRRSARSTSTSATRPHWHRARDNPWRGGRPATPSRSLPTSTASASAARSARAPPDRRRRAEKSLIGAGRSPGPTGPARASDYTVQRVRFQRRPGPRPVPCSPSLTPSPTPRSV